jgi:hypothetical protein
MRFGSIVQGVLGRARRLPAVVGRTGRRSVALGAVLLVGSSASVWATANTPTTITSMTANASSLNAGQALVITGAFTDPDVGDAHTVFVYWNDGVISQGQAEKVQLAPGQHSFVLSHTYPIPVAASIQVYVGDRQQPFHTNDNTNGEGRDSRRFPLLVSPSTSPPKPTPDLAPSFIASSIKVTKAPGQTGLVTIEGDWNDGDDTTGTVTFIPSDEQPPRGLPACTSTGHHFKCIYQYQVPKPVQPTPWIFALDVSDGRGGNAVYKGNVQIP